jgi:hypothetical protein
MEGSLSPKLLNGIANEHDPTHRAGASISSETSRVEIIHISGSP